MNFQPKKTISLKNNVDFANHECKYTNEAIGKRVIDEEKAQTIDLGMNIYKLGFVSKNGFKDSVDMNEYNCISLADMY